MLHFVTVSQAIANDPSYLEIFRNRYKSEYNDFFIRHTEGHDFGLDGKDYRRPFLVCLRLATDTMRSSNATLSYYVVDCLKHQIGAFSEEVSFSNHFIAELALCPDQAVSCYSEYLLSLIFVFSDNRLI